MGRAHGEEGLRDLCELRHVNYNRLPTTRCDPLGFPYRERTEAAMERVIRLVFRRGSAMKMIDLS